ncbi:MAG: lipoprotein insertase outer membrane protein LolB [Gammaproteobacteria bacterium]|nr:lipoprotein insertase outer membrane protein LolB [Gammaproteobacteria bacterium]
MTRGRIRTLEQMGWQIEITDYVDALGRELPRRMEMVNEHLELKLVVQAWEPASA